MKKSELDSAAALNHPGIPKLYGHYEDHASHYMAMEYMPGEGEWQQLTNNINKKHWQQRHITATHQQTNSTYQQLIFCFADLFSFFERRKFQPMDELRAKKIFRELCRIVQHAHSKGIGMLCHWQQRQ